MFFVLSIITICLYIIADIMKKKMKKTDKEILENFIKNIVDNQKEIDTEFLKFVNENFWDLI